MSRMLPFARQTAPCLEPSTDSTEPPLSLKPNELEKLKQNDARILALADRNPFAAALVVDMTATMLKFFDA